MKFDTLIEIIGDFGPYQKRVLFCLYLDSIMDAFHAGLTMFILPHLEYRCALKGMENDTFEIQGTHHEWLINQSIPQEMDNGKIVYNSCERFQDWNGTRVNLEQCNSWVFDKSVYETTIIEELSLVCDQKMMLSHIVTALYLGIFAGAALMGVISDWIGRKYIIVICILIQGIAGISSAFSQTVTQFLILRFIIGFGSSGSFVTSFVLGAEIVGTKRRAWTCMGTQMFYTVGFCFLTAAGYFVTKWRLLIIILSVPSVLLGFSLIWCIQESPRLLYAKNKNEKAYKIVKLIAKKNNRLLPENIEQEKIIVQNVESYGVYKVWTSKKLCLQNFVMGVNWVSVSLCYFALAINSRNLSVNTHLNFFLGALVEFPAYFVAVYLLDHKMGRRVLFASTMVIAGIACLMSSFPYVYGGPALQWMTLMFCLIGRFSITAAFGIIYLYVCEIYPTVARNGALGVYATFNRIGSISAPYIMILGDYVQGNIGKGLPFILLAIVTLVSGPLVLLLPETNNKSIPDTINETKLMQRFEFGKKFRKLPNEAETELKSNQLEENKQIKSIFVVT